MWTDIGLGDWCHNLNEISGEEIAVKLMSVHADYPAAKKKMKKAMTFVRQRHRETMSHIRGQLELPPEPTRRTGQ
ncbi:MAG: hypothetical protein ACYTG0_27090 [Planctomycetota bacterium]|jgi:hypothetical protein